MTPEEAIKIMRKWVEDGGFSYEDGYGWEKLLDEEKEALNIAIKALEDRPYDCISREAVIELLMKEWVKHMPASYALDMNFSIMLSKIDNLPSITPQYNWIPTKGHIMTRDEGAEEYPEGTIILESPMPEENQEVLITVKGSGGSVWVDKDTAMNDGDGWYTDGGYEWLDDIVAWMPLPKPYEEVKDDG